MAKQTIFIGTSPNDGTGDPIRDAFDKVNDNFDELYSSYVATGAITVGNATVNTVVSNTGGLVTSIANASAVVNTSVIRIGNATANVAANSTQVAVFGNSTLGTAVVNTSLVSVGNATVNSTLSQSNLLIATASTNASFIVNSTTIFLGNSTINVSANSSRLTVNTANVLSNSFTLGSSSVGSSDFANGYSRLPNGLLMQWGYNAAVNSTANLNTFAAIGGVEFVNVFTVTATSTTQNNFVAVTAANSTTFTVIANASSNTGVYWTAIGK